MRFIKLTSPPELEQAIGDGIHSCGLDTEHLDWLHSEYRMAVDNSAPEGVAAQRFYRYRVAVVEARRRQEETKALIERARVYLVGLSLN
ncbi:MAG: hypothetical protein ACLQU2_37340 [Candidatus Binataceae bacterium]